MNSLAFSYCAAFFQLIFCACAFHAPHHHQFQIDSLKPPSRCNTLLCMSSEHTPSEQEIAKQKAETYQALSSFHETRAAARTAGDTSLFGGYDDDQDANMAEYWECKDGAVSFPVPMDPAAGLKKGVISKPYRSNVQVQMNINRSSTTGSLQRQGLRLVETMQFQDDEDNLLPPFVRSIPMDANVDVDSADGSYSLDVTISGDEHLPLLPASMSAGLNPVCIKFLVEHTIAISDFERCRCFFIYGDADRDGGAKEERDFEDEDDRGDEDFDEDDSSDRINRNYRLLGVVFADESKKLPANTVPPKPAGISSLLNKEQPATSESPLDLLRLDATEIIEMSDQDKMDALYKAIGKHNERVMANSDGTNQSKEGNVASMTRYTPTMYNICSGVYLGDTFIREPLKSIGKSQSKGFGNLKSRRSDEEDKHDAFARWSLGVQKTSIQFYWDYSANVIQACQYGKSLGAVNKLKCNAMSRSVGTVVVDEGRVTKPRQERRTIWYLDGAYVAGLIGSSYFRAPRYMSFSESHLNAADARLTEFLVFYKADISSVNTLNGEAKESYCSLARRLYNLDGSLLQGSTGFFSLSQPAAFDDSES